MTRNAASHLLILALALILWIPSTLFFGCDSGGDAPPPSASEGGAEVAPESAPPSSMRCLYYERELFLSAMSAPRAYAGAGRLAAGMIPHHLLASDMIAGFFRLAAEEPEGYDTVLFVSPSHFPENCGSDVVTSTWSWETPYGLVETDSDLAGALLRNAAVSAEDNPAAMEADHGVAGLIPFVRYYLPDAKVAACLLSNKLDRRRLSAVREEIAELCAGGRVLLVASVDCSHYLTPEEAALRDAETAEAIEGMDIQRILSFSDANVDSPQALTTLLTTVQALDGDLVRLDHSSSGEKLPYAISNPIYQEGVTTYFAYAAFTGQAEEESLPADIPPETASDEREAVVAVVGDLMVHEEQLRSAYDPGTVGYDFSPGFQWIAGDIAAADLAVGNLETVFAGEGAGYSGYPRFNTPDSFAATLKETGFDFLSTANNHCLDQGDEGLSRTLDVLDLAGIGHTGTFSAPGESKAPVVEVNGIRIALAAFTYGTNDIAAGQPGLVNRLDREGVRAVLQEARAQGPDWIIALPHMGGEYQTSPGLVYSEWAEYILSCGADAVLAAHPHVLQSIAIRERRPRRNRKDGALIAYSLGNFLAFQREPPRETGVILKLRIAKSEGKSAYLREVSIIPIWTQHQDAAGRLVTRVLPIDDAVRDYEGGNALNLQRRDYFRLLKAHDEVATLFLGEAMTHGNRQREYILYSVD